MKGVATIEILRRASTKRVAIIVAQDISKGVVGLFH